MCYRCDNGTVTEQWPCTDRYNVVRFYFNRPGYRYTILRNVTLEQAQTHCRNPETSSSTCTGKVGKARTRKLGPWFDGYEKEGR